MRKIYLVALSILVMITLAGCAGDLLISMNTKIYNSAGAGELIVSLSGTDFVNTTLRDGDFSEYAARVQDAGFSVRRYIEGENAHLEFRGIFGSLTELNDLQANILAPLQLAPIVESSSQPGLLSVSNNYSVICRPSVYAGEDSVEAFARDTRKLGNEPPTNIMLTYRLTTPGKIISSNAMETDKQTSAWNLSEGQMRSNISLGVLSQQVRYGRVAGAAALAVLLLFAVYRWFFF